MSARAISPPQIRTAQPLGCPEGKALSCSTAKQCGLRVDEGNRFCQSCGQEVGSRCPGRPCRHRMRRPLSTGVSVRFPFIVAIRGFLGSLRRLLRSTALFWASRSCCSWSSPFSSCSADFVLMMRMNPSDPRAAAAIAGPLLFGYLLAMLLFMILGWLYFAGMESSERQATFGKAVMSLHVTDLEGQRLSVKPRHRTILCEDHFRIDPVRDWLHHGRIYGQETGPARLDGGDAGSAEVAVSSKTIRNVNKLQISSRI